MEIIEACCLHFAQIILNLLLLNVLMQEKKKIILLSYLYDSFLLKNEIWKYNEPVKSVKLNYKFMYNLFGIKLNNTKMCSFLYEWWPVYTKLSTIIAIYTILSIKQLYTINELSFTQFCYLWKTIHFCVR